MSRIKVKRDLIAENCLLDLEDCESEDDVQEQLDQYLTEIWNLALESAIQRLDLVLPHKLSVLATFQLKDLME